MGHPAVVAQRSTRRHPHARRSTPAAPRHRRDHRPGAPARARIPPLGIGPGNRHNLAVMTGETVMHKNTTDECCTGHENESGCRNNYYIGKRLTADSFRVEQRYLIERRHLVNRAMHGWGVVYGLPIASASGKLTIGAGLALDKWGRELLQVGTSPVTLDDLIVIDEKGAPTALARAAFENGKPAPVPTECWLLSVHYAEESAGPVAVNDSCRCEHQEWEHTCETVRYSLRRIACGDCCDDAECALTCVCGTGKCCDDRVAVGNAQPPKA